MLALFTVSLSFSVSPSLHTRVAMHSAHRATRVYLCDSGDASSSEKLQGAAARVVSAASLFGDEQGAAAAAWVKDALQGTKSDVASLLDQQLSLFEGCIITDDGAQHCMELDAALDDLLAALAAAEECIIDDEGGGALQCIESDAKLDRALARVRVAASQFGKDQARVATIWTEQVKSTGAANPAVLLEQQVALFDECLVEYGEEGPNKCKELQDSLNALQSALGVGGRVVSTKGFMPVPKK